MWRDAEHDPRGLFCERTRMAESRMAEEVVCCMPIWAGGPMGPLLCTLEPRWPGVMPGQGTKK